MNKFFLPAMLVLVSFININAQDTAHISIPFEVYDNGINGGGYKILYFGLDQTASDAVDYNLGESNLPPFPPDGAFDARFFLPEDEFSGILSSYKDYRDTEGFPFTGTVIHRIKWQPKDDADSVFFAWNFPQEISGTLKDLFNGISVNIPLSGTGVYALTGATFAFDQLVLEIYYDDVFPVELVSFTARVIGQDVRLLWKTATETNNYGFDVEKRSQSTNQFLEKGTSEWTKIGFVIGNGNSNSPKEYSYFDKNVETGKYYYRLKQIDTDGTFKYLPNIFGIAIDVHAPMEFTLMQNYPNPFNPATEILFSVPQPGNVNVIVYDMLGSEIRTLFSEQVQSGNYRTTWDGLNDAGVQMSAGTYFYRMTAGEFQQVKKMLLLR